MDCPIFSISSDFWFCWLCWEKKLCLCWELFLLPALRSWCYCRSHFTLAFVLFTCGPMLPFRFYATVSSPILLTSFVVTCLVSGLNSAVHTFSCTISCANSVLPSWIYHWYKPHHHAYLSYSHKDFSNFYSVSSCCDVAAHAFVTTTCLFDVHNTSCRVGYVLLHANNIIKWSHTNTGATRL